MSNFTLFPWADLAQNSLRLAIPTSKEKIPQAGDVKLLHISYRELEIGRDLVIQIDIDRDAVANLEPVLPLKSVPLEAQRGYSGVGDSFLKTGQLSKDVFGVEWLDVEWTGQ